MRVKNHTTKYRENQIPVEGQSQDISQMSMETLRTALILYCRLLGIRQSTCLSLILLLNERALLLPMLQFMAEKDEERIQDVMDPDDITTMVVNVAAELRDAWDRKNRCC